MRVEGDFKARQEELKKVFGDIKVVTLDDVSGEFAVITPVITEAQYEEAASGLPGIITRIRVENA